MKQFLRIKWLLTVRCYTRRKWEGAMALATMAVVSFAALVFSLFAVFAAHSASDASLRGLLSTTVWLLVGLLILLPTLHLDIAGSLDLSQMLVYPLGAKDFLQLALIDGAVSPSGLIMCVAIVPLTAAFARDQASALIWILLLALLFLFVVSLAQLVAVVAMRLKASRRFVNLFLAIFAALVIAGEFMAGYSGWGQHERTEEAVSLLTKHLPDLSLAWKRIAAVMHFTPPAAAAESYLGWLNLDFVQFAAWFAIFIGGIAFTLGVTGWVYYRLFKGELALAESPPVRAGARTRYAKRATGVRLLVLRMPPGLVATMQKEWRYLWREPHIKAQLISVLAAYAYLAAVITGLAHKGGSDWAYKGWIFLGFVCFLGLFTSQRFANKFGLDAEAIEVTFVTPIARWQLLLGKGLPYLLLFGLTNGAAALLAGLFLHVSPIFIFCGIALVMAHLPLVDAVGNLVSIYFPVALVPGRGRRLRPVRQQQGCLFLLLHGLAFQVAQLLVLPVAGILAVLAWSGSWLLVAPLTALICAYVFFVARHALRLSVRALKARETGITAFMLSANR